MHEPGLDIPEEFYAYKDRASAYIARASHFPFQWGLPNGARNKNGFPIEFFRWDRRVLKRMIDRAEHIIRCLIIWMTWARLRSGLVEPVYSPLLARGSHPGRDPGLDALRPTFGRVARLTDIGLKGAALSPFQARPQRAGTTKMPRSGWSTKKGIQINFQKTYISMLTKLHILSNLSSSTRLTTWPTGPGSGRRE